MAASVWRCASFSCSRSRGLLIIQRRLAPTSHLIVLHQSSSSTTNDFFERNRQLNRPVSPHLSILMKNPEIITILSISHRITGAMMSFDVWALTLAWLASGRSFTQMIETVQAMSLHPYLLVAGKFSIALPFTYHLFNGIRHLNWDTGRGFDIQALHRNGYIVLSLAILSAIGLSLYTPKL